MKHGKQILLILLSAVILSCTERIDIETGEGYERLIVDGAITTDKKAHTIVLSATSDYFSNKPVPMVTGATVSISDGGVTYYLKESSPGIYQTDPHVFGRVGHTYTLKIKLATPIGGHSDYTASSKIQPSTTLDSINLKFFPDYSEKGLWEIRGFIQNSPDIDFYRFLVFRNEEMVTDTLNEWYVTDSRFYYRSYINGAIVAFLHQHRPGEALTTGDRVMIEMDIISKEYANFIWDAQTEMRGSYPLFSGPPANVKGNINNGAIGFFAAYSISRATALVPERVP